MGLRNALRLVSAVDALPPLQVQAPWAGPSHLETIVWAELLDSEIVPVDRAVAMSVPAVARARHLIAGTIAGCPLYAARGTERLEPPDAPTFTYRTDGPVSPWHRMLWTVDDQLFTGFSLWRVTRDTANQVTDALRVNRDEWQFAGDNKSIEDLNGRPLPATDYILLPGPHEGILSFASATIREAKRLEASAGRHAANPVPSVALEQTLDVDIEQSEIDAMVDRWVKARRAPNGSVAYTAYGVTAKVLGQVPEALLIDGRNAAAVNIARHVSMPAATLDATNAGASLTYETTAGRNQQFLDFGLDLYFSAISARLSMDDVVARGTRIAFEVSELTSVSTAALNPAQGID